MKYKLIEHHPNDSRTTIKDDDVCQSLTSRMGTGGGNIPLILVIIESSGASGRTKKKANDAKDYERWIESEITNCLNLFDLGDIRTAELIVYEDIDRKKVL